MVTNDPAVTSTRLLGLGSKLYPSNKPRMLNKDLTRFMQTHSGSEQAKEKVCWQRVRPTARMSNENADVPSSKFDVSLDGTLLSHTTNLNALFWLMLYELAESAHWKRENTNFLLRLVLQCSRCLRSTSSPGLFPQKMGGKALGKSPGEKPWGRGWLKVLNNKWDPWILT